MKTGMEWPLLGLALLLALVIGWNAWNDAQVELSVATLNATAAGEQLPGPAVLVGEWTVKAVVGTLIGGIVTAIISAVVIWGRRQWRRSQQSQAHSQGQWQNGPNAYWGKQPRVMSEAELYRLALMQQLMGQQGGTRATIPRVPPMEVADDEPTITL